MLVEERFQYAIHYEEFAMAHIISHLLAEKKISLDDDESKIDLNQVDHQKVAEMIQNNVLGIHKVCIYSLKMDQTYFVFIFARSEQEAIQFYIDTFQQSPLNCHEYPLDFEIARGKGAISFRDMRREYESFPAIAGYSPKIR